MKWKKCSITLTCVGLVLIILSLVWLLAIFPPMVKLPADYDMAYYFEGTNRVMNPQTGAMDEIPVKITRTQQATEVKDNVLIIKQDVKTTHAVAGVELPQFGQSEILGVNRSTRQYVPGYGDMDRSGQFGFPAGVEKKDYSLWISTAGRPLSAKFTGEEDFEGLKVFIFKFNEKDIDLGQQKGTGLPQSLDFTAEMKVETVSGTTVHSVSDTTIKITAAPGVKMPYYISSIKFTGETVKDLVDTAKAGKNAILWGKVYGFWLGMGIGILLVLAGITGSICSKRKEKASA